jgi:sugar lactone lactonase YvrE
MHARIAAVLMLVSLAIAGCAGLETGPGPGLRVLSDTRVTGFAFPESVGCDPYEGVLYVSQFGGTELKPAEKDGNGFISKLARDGSVLDKRVFSEKMNKPKGIWVERGKLWVTDIDSVWIFDTRTKKGRRLPLPTTFANDPAVVGGVLYVTDNRADMVVRVEPADFLDEKVQPKVTEAFAKKSVNPNGIWPAADGTLLIAGFLAADQPRAIFAYDPRDGSVRTVTQALGRLDGLYEMRDGSILATDWNSGSLFHWSPRRGMVPLAKDFKGPADFCVMGETVYVPDLVQSQVRIIRLAR